MIKILLSPSRRGLTSRCDSLPPVRSRRAAAAHLSSCLASAGGRRVGRTLPLKPQYLTFVFRGGNKRESWRLPGRMMKVMNTPT